MASGLVLVNGLPGSGKTTLGGSIAAALDVPLVSKDVIKEALADVAAGTVASRRLGQIASDTMWELAAAIPGTAVVESWWHAPRDLAFVTAGVARSGRPRLVQVWCEVPADVARRRYDERRRHPIHVVGEEARMQAEEWTEFSPLPIEPVVEVDTTGPVDLEPVVARIRAALGA